MAKYHLPPGAVLIIFAWLAVSGGAHAADAPGEPARESSGAATEARPKGPPPAPAALKRKPRMSDRCYTPAINCIQFEREPVGSPCWCVTPFGPSYGRLR